MTDHARAGHTVRMSDRDGTAADVQPFDGNAEALLAIEHLDCKGLVQLPKSDVIDAEAETLEQLGHREHGANPHFVRFGAGDGHPDIASERLKAALGREPGLHHDASRRAVGELRCIAGSDRATVNDRSE